MPLSPFSIDWKNALLIGLVLLLAGVVGIWVPYERAKDTLLPDTLTDAGELIVEYRETGFVPEEITVKVGTTVEWRSPLGRPMWVASDPHPSHTDLEGFDQRGISLFRTWLAPRHAHAHGESAYTYTFTNVGVWNYHNHLYPQDRGTIIVIPK